MTGIHLQQRCVIAGCAWLALSISPALADAPATAYIFPAGGQRGAEVTFRVGGVCLHDGAAIEMLGPGVDADPRIEPTRTIWFEGPVIPLPDSQAAEDYPKDYAGHVRIAPDAAPGHRAWQIWTAQGVAASRPFVVGQLPEVVEEEIDGSPLPVTVNLPVTINGRIFPREDIDIWQFTASAGQSLTCTAVAAQLGSPLDVQLEVIGPDGRRIAESVPTQNVDAFLRFIAPVGGSYQVRIRDARFGGLQSYIYRLTVTAGFVVDSIYPLGGRRGTTTLFELTGQGVPQAPVPMALPANGPAEFFTWLDLPGGDSARFAIALNDFPEILEAEPNDNASLATPAALPVIVNGRVDKPGDVDYWKFVAKAGEAREFAVEAARLGSPLIPVVSITDAAGKTVTQAELAAGVVGGVTQNWSVPADGDYYLRLQDRFASRGGPAFAYRIKMGPAAVPGFRLVLAADAVTVARAGEAKFKVRVERVGGFAGPISLDVANLPAGVSVAGTTIARNATEANLVFKAEEQAPIRSTRVQIRGTGESPASSGGPNAAAAGSIGPVMATATGSELDSLRLAVALPTPFKVKGVFETKYAQRGARFVRHFSIVRNGFTGPLEVSLADRQFRHLQGVRGTTIVVPAEAAEFDYPIDLPPWMEIGRTSRTVVTAAGEVDDGTGVRHKVGFTSVDQADQIIVLVDPEQLSIRSDRATVRAVAGRGQHLHLQLGRGPGLDGPVRVELVVPEHTHGVEATPLTIAAGQLQADWELRFAANESGPFTMPLVIRATTEHAQRGQIVAESPLEIVSDSAKIR